MEIGFKEYHPVVNLIFFVSIIVFGLILKHPITLMLCFVAALSFYIRLCGRSAVKSVFLFLLPMLVFVVIINGLFAHYGTTPLLTLPDGNQLTLESLVYGFVLGLVSVTVIIWFFCYNEVVTADKFMFVFGRIMPAAALVFSMALRFIPMYRKRLKTIAEAQQGIGKDFKTGTFPQRIKNAGSILSVLITWSLENAVETSDSMKARGYGLNGRTNYSRFRWSIRDITALSVMLIIDAVLIFGCIKKSLNCIYNPFIIINPSAEFGHTYFINELNLTINPVSLIGIITLTAFGILCFLPLIIDLKEDIKWNRSKSKI